MLPSSGLGQGPGAGAAGPARLRLRAQTRARRLGLGLPQQPAAAGASTPPASGQCRAGVWLASRRPLAAGVENDGRGPVTRFVGEPEPALTSDLSCHTSLWENSQRHAAPALMPPRFSSYARLPPIHIPATTSRQRPARQRPPAAASAAQHPAEGVLLGHVAISDHLRVHFLHVPPPLRAPIRSSPISSARENVIQGRRSLRVHARRDATRRVSLRVYACTLWDPPAA